MIGKATNQMISIANTKPVSIDRLNAQLDEKISLHGCHRQRQLLEHIQQVKEKKRLAKAKKATQLEAAKEKQLCGGSTNNPFVGPNNFAPARRPVEEPVSEPEEEKRDEDSVDYEKDDPLANLLYPDSEQSDGEQHNEPESDKENVPLNPQTGLAFKIPKIEKDSSLKKAKTLLGRSLFIDDEALSGSEGDEEPHRSTKAKTSKEDDEW